MAEADWAAPMDALGVNVVLAIAARSDMRAVSEGDTSVSFTYRAGSWTCSIDVILPGRKLRTKRERASRTRIFAHGETPTEAAAELIRALPFWAGREA